MFLILVRNILCPQQMFSSLRNMRYIMSNNVSATMCLRLPVPLLAQTFNLCFLSITSKNLQTDVMQFMKKYLSNIFFIELRW